MAPENHLQLAEIGFAQVSAFVDWAVIDSADFDGKRIRLRRDEKIRAEIAEFARETIAHFERYRERGGGDGHADHQGGGREHFAARIANEGFPYEASKHV